METTLFPLATLPACANECGHLFDANGACVPPAQPTAAASVYDACFCADSRLTAFSTGTAGVCDDACTATPADLNSIRNWYTSFCAKNGQVKGGKTTTTTAGSGGSSAGSTKGSDGGGGSWLSTHYQWVIFLVVMVVAIAGIWVGACIWRRRYLRRKDRQYALDKRLSQLNDPSRASAAGGSTGHGASSIHIPRPGLFQPAPITSAGVFDTSVGEEKPKKVKQKKKWIPTERT
ncbi:hypothetical protein VTK73DRAFT_8690 [Phialemonium thermophilum]|uniref:Integral membrane protein n=1 Tax=Phialemonium thermophilum TaxID=223376 RepID=A0ABR3W6X6_9PEZI